MGKRNDQSIYVKFFADDHSASSINITLCNYIERHGGRMLRRAVMEESHSGKYDLINTHDTYRMEDTYLILGAGGDNDRTFSVVTFDGSNGIEKTIANIRAGMKKEGIRSRKISGKPKRKKLTYDYW